VSLFAQGWGKSEACFAFAAHLLQDIRAGLFSPFMEPRKTRQHGVAGWVDIDRRVSAAEAKVRLAERDRRLDADTRTEAQRWLGDPPSARSALGRRVTQAALAEIVDSLIFHLRRQAATRVRHRENKNSLHVNRTFRF